MFARSYFFLLGEELSTPRKSTSPVATLSTFIHNTPRPTRTNRTQKREGQHLAHVTAASFSCSRHATCTALTDTDQSRHTPGHFTRKQCLFSQNDECALEPCWGERESPSMSDLSCGKRRFLCGRDVARRASDGRGCRAGRGDGDTIGASVVAGASASHAAAARDCTADCSSASRGNANCR